MEPKYEGDGLITDSRRIEIFFRRDGLAQRYLRNMKWMDEATKTEYMDHLLFHRRRKVLLGYGKTGMQYAEFQEDNGLIPQIEETFRKVLNEEADIELERKIMDIRDPLIRKRITESCARCREEVLHKLDGQFKKYNKLIESGMVDAIPAGLFEYKV